MDLKDKTCLITGGTSGIGAAAAFALAGKGARTVIVGRHDGPVAAETRKRIAQSGQVCEFIATDCGKADDCVRCVEQTIQKMGSVDVLVHAAGSPVPGSFLEVRPQDWAEAFNVHIHAVYHLCRAAIPQMRKKKEGAVVLISSVAGLRGLKTCGAYQTVKGALPQFARALAREFADDNIRVNCVAPGIIRTPFHANMSEEKKKFNVEQRIPLHGEGTPQQVAQAILMLVENDYITGETISIDGGLAMRAA